MPRHVNPKNLEKRHKGTKKPKESSDESHYAPSYYTGSYYDSPTYGGGHGYFKPAPVITCSLTMIPTARR